MGSTADRSLKPWGRRPCRNPHRAKGWPGGWLLLARLIEENNDLRSSGSRTERPESAPMTVAAPPPPPARRCVYFKADVGIGVVLLCVVGWEMCLSERCKLVR